MLSLLHGIAGPSTHRISKCLFRYQLAQVTRSAALLYMCHGAERMTSSRTSRRELSTFTAEEPQKAPQARPLRLTPAHVFSEQLGRVMIAPG